jgi:hypothetical protein
MIPRGLGLRQPSAAFPPQDWRRKSGRGLPQSRTLTRDSLNPDQLFGYSIFETALPLPQSQIDQLDSTAGLTGHNVALHRKTFNSE